MSKYIDADKTALAVVKATTYGGALRAVREQPTIDLDDYVPREFHDKTCEAMAKAHQEEIADMVSVVRCKECYMCDEEMWCSFYDSIMESDDFCSYGEREGEWERKSDE